MTEKQYLERNAKGYEGDTFIHSEIEKLVKQFNVVNIVETGTYKGATSKRLSDFAPVVTVEFDANNFAESCRNLKGYSVKPVHGDSSTCLKEVVPPTLVGSVLFMLDAHWGDNWPLLAEFRQIAELGIKPVIVIHDFKVPGKDFGYDSYAGQELDFNYIEGSLLYIYGEDGYSYHYNEQADGGYRGVIYIYPKVRIEGVNIPLETNTGLGYEPSSTDAGVMLTKGETPAKEMTIEIPATPDNNTLDIPEGIQKELIKSLPNQQQHQGKKHKRNKRK